MKISYNWLKEYANIDMDTAELGSLLTGCGLEVEGIEHWQSVEGGLEGVVIAEVLTCSKMPDSDHLSITTVDAGNNQVYPVVCGAPNVAAGQKVVFAKPGSFLTINGKKLEIRKARLRGYESHGMICAEDEVGLGTSHEGIMVLKPDTVPGTPAKDYFKLEEDVVFSIGLTPNRTDAMSHIGVARDILAVLKNAPEYAQLHTETNLRIPSVEDFQTDNNSLEIPVTVENPEACPRYAGVTISGICVKESPAWLQNKLLAIGLRPINNIVDITNFVLHETGQPLHAFDADEIAGNHIIVKKFPAGTRFITLDEMERELSGEDLMICNAESPMCIGGVFGGLSSGVTSKTTSIFLESAVFDPVSIRITSKYHDLQTDASFRFERGVDTEMTLFALKRAALLIKEIAGGHISSSIQDVAAGMAPQARVNMSYNRIMQMIGKDIGRKMVNNILLSLDFSIMENEGAESFTVEVPRYRVDVTREADVVEEILRIYGYNNVEIPQKIYASVSGKTRPETEKLQAIVSNYLTNNGFWEIMNNSLTAQQYYDSNGYFHPDNTVTILNPLSSDLSVMRQTLLFGMLESVSHNLNRKSTDLSLFEFGKSYQSVASFKKEVTERYRETSLLALAVTGRSKKESWHSAASSFDLFILRSHLESILKKLHVSPEMLSLSDAVPEFYSYGLAYTLDQTVLFTTGKISAALLKKWDIEQDVFFAEINWDMLISLADKSAVSFSELPRFPAVRRDVAMLLSKEVYYDSIKRIAYKTEKRLLREINLFDVYEGENIEQGKKSYAVSFILQDRERTLTDKVIEKTMQQLKSAFERELGAVIR